MGAGAGRVADDGRHDAVDHDLAVLQFVLGDGDAGRAVGDFGHGPGDVGSEGNDLISHYYNDNNDYEKDN